jgi:hypothetical protein
MNFNKILSEMKNHLSTVVTILTLDAYRRTVISDRSATKMEEIKKKIEELHKIKLDLDTQEISNNNLLESTNMKIIKMNSELNRTIENIEHKSKLLYNKLDILNKNKDLLTSEVKTKISFECDNIVDELVKESEEHSNIVHRASIEIQDIITSSKSGGSSQLGSNYIEGLWDKFNYFLNNASAAELGAVGHISASVVVLFCLWSLVTVFYGDKLIIKFKLEEKFPKLAKFIQLRRKFQHYYFFYNVLFIVLILSYVIYINVYILINID